LPGPLCEGGSSSVLGGYEEDEGEHEPQARVFALLNRGEGCGEEELGPGGVAVAARVRVDLI
jgi:hypothetical protein